MQTLLVNANPVNSTFRWLGPSGGIIPRTQYNTSEINGSTVYIVRLTALTQSRDGIYTCEVQNRIGATNLTFMIVIIGEF